MCPEREIIDSGILLHTPYSICMCTFSGACSYTTVVYARCIWELQSDTEFP